MTLKNTTNKAPAPFSYIRISRAAFIALSKKRIDYMSQGKTRTCAEIASEILEAVK